MTLFYLLLSLGLFSATFSLLYQRDVVLVNFVSLASLSAILILACALPFFMDQGTLLTIPVLSFSRNQLSLVLQYDDLTWVMLCLIGFVSLFIQSYSTRYLLSDNTQARFIGQISLLTTAVMLLVMSGNLFTAFVGWQLVGFCLYLLLNHYHYDPRANKAAKKKFIINRIGDVCFLLAVLFAYTYYDSSHFEVLFANHVHLIPVDSWFTPKTMILLLIFIAVMTKSAQFPFHIWLPDTMETPTPVSALMHAGVINSGGFLLARLSPWLVQQPLILDLIFIIGLLSMLLGGFFMLTQTDVKKQLAYSTMGQMGYMVMQCGLGCFAAAVFHLIAHGFFKATLFLQAGYDITSTHLTTKVSPVKAHPGIRLVVTLIVTALILGMGLLWQQWLGETTVNFIIWLFLAFTLAQLIWQTLAQATPWRVMAITIFLFAILFLAYLWAFNVLSGRIHHVAFENARPQATWQMVLVGLAILVNVAFYYIPATRLLDHVGYKKLYLLSLNKLNIENFYRTWLLNPLRQLGDWGYQILTLGKKPIALWWSGGGLLLTVIGMTLYGFLNWQQAHHIAQISLVWINLGVLLIALIIGNRTQTLTELWFMVVIGTLAFSNVALFIGNMEMRLISIYHLVNTLVLLMALAVLFTLYHKKADSVPIVANRLPWISCYMSVLLLLLIGVPGTASFISEFYLLHELLVQHIVMAFWLALAMILLALVVLHGLQRYVFNPTHFSRVNPHFSPTMHVICWLAIGFNLFNGIDPAWLLHGLSLLRGM